jgi:O-antigen/teichoic acid export membrane protein
MLGKVTDMLRDPKGRDTLFTFLTEGLSMLGMVLVFRLAKDRGDVAFDQYVIVRRSVAFAFPVVLMGTMVGLTRFIAMSADPAEQRRFLLGALAWVLPLGLLVCATGALIPGPLAWFCFGSYEETPLILPLAVMTFGIALHGVAYGFLRGSGRSLHANAIQLFALAIGPCLAFYFFHELEGVLWFTGCAWMIVSGLSLAPTLMRRGRVSNRLERASIVRYGLPRVPGDIALGALLTVPVFVVVRTFNREMGAEYAFACTLLNLAAAVFSPVALLLLPAASTQLSTGDHAGLAKRISWMLKVIFGASLLLTLGFELLATPFLKLYLGASGESFVATGRLVFLAALPFAFFNGMRSVLDAYYQTPRNGMNLVVAFGLMIIGSLVHLLINTPWYTMGAVLIIALSYLGWATWRDVRYVGSELERLAKRRSESINVLVVIPDVEDGVLYRDSKEQAKAFIDHGTEVTFFHLENRSSPLQLIRSRQRLKKTIRLARPDVLHVHFGSVAALWTVLSSPLPVVVTFMGDDLDRSTVRGIARPWVGGLFSQIAAFFAAGIICTDEEVRDNLWWRMNEAKVIPLEGDALANAKQALDHLRAVALHRSTDHMIA